MEKFNNPYRKRTMLWALMEEDWSDLTIQQIAEVFSTSYASVQQAIIKIHKKTGYTVPHAQMKVGRPKNNEYL